MNSTISFDQIVTRLREQFPDHKLLALGQTVYWDEPMKAVLRRLLDEKLPETRMMVGIHDADYFSKLPSNLAPKSDWVVLPHNDGSTKDLWVATGEISALFGSETIPTRELLVSHGVQIDKIARDYPCGRDMLIDSATEAWGWRGLVHVDSGSEIACSIPLKDSLPHLLELLEWGFSHTLDALVEADAERGRRVADELLNEVRSYAESHPDDVLTDLFADVLMHFYGRLLGYVPANIESTSATELFSFNSSTAGLPRFKPLRAFLDPKTKAACEESYNIAVTDSDMYSLDRFPEGALPFDLVVCGRGRGTICIRGREVMIDFDEPVLIPTSKTPTTPEELAALFESKFGQKISLVGTAVTLELMMASEFIFVLNEEASAYVPICENMASLMKERGVDLSFCPILRINYHAWDSISSCAPTFQLPGHLAAAFRQGEITAREFADSWWTTAGDQEALLERIAAISNLDELLAFLAEHQGPQWAPRIEAYMTAYATIRSISDRTEPMKDESIRLRDLSHKIKAEVQQLESEKGKHFRGNVKSLQDRLDALETDGVSGSEVDDLRSKLQKQLVERKVLEHAIEQKREEAQHAHNRSLDLKNEVAAIERGKETISARETVKAVEYEAELARLWLVRDAILVSKGLKYANHRPPAWWFLLVDPELKWFERIVETAEFRFEEIST